MRHNSTAPARRYLRSPLQVPVMIMSGGQHFSARGVQIGEGGLSFESERELILGATVVVSIRLGAGITRRLTAEVRNRVRTEFGYVYGCAFASLEVSSRYEIRDYVARWSEGTMS